MDCQESAKTMTKEEFLKKVNNYGIDLDSFFIVIGYEPKWMYYTGIYQDDKDWIIYEVNGRNEATVVYKGTEERSFSELYSMLLGRISRKGFVNESITKNVIQTSKQDVDSFLQRKYAIFKQDAENTWNYLKWDFHILNELKYFALHDQFVSVDDCYKVHGYSAENIANKLGLNAVGSYKYLINLEKDSDRYLPKIEMMEESK